MTIKRATPYLFFNGNAARALAHYERALGAKVEGLQRYGDAPNVVDCTDADKDRVMHALVRIGDATLMVSDVPPHMTASKSGNGEVCLDFTDAEMTARMFEALAEGGTVRMNLHDTHWGAKFGTLKDAYDIHWMFNCEPATP
jgi:PhnB protein